MAIPDNRLSTTVVDAEFLAPDILTRSRLLDYERGGVALDDPSQGLNVRNWTAGIDGDNLYCEDDANNRTTLLVRPGTTSISLAFDQNMRATLAYVQSGVAKLWWYDAAIAGRSDTSFPGARFPRLCMDDKRSTQSLANDVIFAYVRDGNLYYRQQRDRYNTERLLMAGVAGTFRNMGLHRGNRLRFEFS